jgi:hypothetical protein
MIKELKNINSHITLNGNTKRLGHFEYGNESWNG